MDYKMQTPQFQPPKKRTAGKTPEKVLAGGNHIDLIQDPRRVKIVETEMRSRPPTKQKGGVLQTKSPATTATTSLETSTPTMDDEATTVQFPPNDDDAVHKRRVNIQSVVVTKEAPPALLTNKSKTLQPGGASGIRHEDLCGNLTGAQLQQQQQHQQQQQRKYTTLDSYLTITGTIKRGRKKGETLDLTLDISREELQRLREKIAATPTMRQRINAKSVCCTCERKTGAHIVALSMMAIPFVALATAVYSFYIGTLTWYNFFNYFNEEKPFVWRLAMSPLLVVCFPILILACTLGLTVYAAGVQLSVNFNAWLNEVADLEKGFYGWLCGALNLADCSPYEVVILNEFCVDATPGAVGAGERGVVVVNNNCAAAMNTEL